MPRVFPYRAMGRSAASSQRAAVGGSPGASIGAMDAGLYSTGRDPVAPLPDHLPRDGMGQVVGSARLCAAGARAGQDTGG